jgi:hypothetical protein
LPELTEKRIRRGVFTSVTEQAIWTYFEQIRQTPNLSVRTKSIREILEKSPQQTSVRPHGRILNRNAQERF